MTEPSVWIRIWAVETGNAPASEAVVPTAVV